MQEVSRCSRCLLPENLDGISFDEQGVCNYCRKYEHDFAGWDTIEDRKKAEFEKMLDKAKSLRRPYDCLVPLFGGKDSTYVLYLVTKVYDMRVLAVTLDNGYLSSAAKTNIENALAYCDADHFFYHINKANSSELFRLFTEKTGDFCNACMRGINYAIEMAVRSFSIPLVIKGSGRRVQYVSQIKELGTLNTPSYYANVLHGSDVENKFKHMARFKGTLERQKIVGGLADILSIRRHKIMKYVPQHIGLYDYMYLPVQEIISILKQEMGWSDFGGTAEHLDCELHDVPFFKNTLLISNITSSTFHNSGLLRQGIISKEEALRRESQDIAREGIPTDLAAFLAENGICYSQYEQYVINAKNYKYNNKLQKLAREIYHRFRKF